MSSPWDVLIIGGGAAGLMAAGQAAALGASTLLVEKMDRPGRKLLITGKGRCNITNTAPLDEFIPHFGPNGRFLYSAFHRFFNADLVEFFNDIGVASVEERGGRVFPASDDAGDVVEALDQWARAMGVTIWTGARVERLLVDDQRVTGVQLSGGNRHAARAVIVTTGGASYPGTGSTGDGYRLAQTVGHTIVPIRPALIPLDTAGNVARRLEGLSLRNVRASLWVNGKLTASEFGEMLFTGFGVSGPIILTLSGRAVDALRTDQPVQVSIDLKPALDDDQLEARLLRDFEEHRKKEFHTLLKGLLPRTLIPVCCDLVQHPRG